MPAQRRTAGFAPYREPAFEGSFFRMTRIQISGFVTAAATILVLLAGCQKKESSSSTVSKKDIADVAGLLADTAGSMNDRPDPAQLPPRMVFTREDIPREGGYLQVTIGEITDEQANQFMRRVKSEHCTCGCPHTIDQCMIADPQCDVAQHLATQILKEVTQGS
jgi:hypothetical protein